MGLLVGIQLPMGLGPILHILYGLQYQGPLTFGAVGSTLPKEGFVDEGGTSHQVPLTNKSFD